MGARDNPRYAFGETTARPQYDPPSGPEALVEEVVTVRGLQAGAARIYLRTIMQPQVPGRTANRNIALIYLTADMEDSWVGEMRKRANLYPILEAFRDSQRQLKALMFNHSTHTIGVLGGAKRSPSFCGLAAQELEAELHGVASFIEGASGSR